MRTLSYYLEMADDEYRIANDFLFDDLRAQRCPKRLPIRLRNIPNEAGVVLCDIADYVKFGEFTEDDDRDADLDGEEYVSMDFAQNYVKILRGETLSWSLSVITISPDIVVLGFGNKEGSGGECLHLSAPWPPYLDVMFEVSREDGGIDRYRLTIDAVTIQLGENDRQRCTLSLTEYEGQTRRVLDFVGSHDPDRKGLLHITEYR